MKKHVFYWLALILIVFIGCQKEESFENGNTPAQGSLQSDATGDCLPKTVNGAYVATTALTPTTNTITVQVNVVNTGNYVITTDTVNGYYFRANGVFTTLGNVDVTLRGNGTPFAEGVDNFIVSFDSTVCDIAVTVLPAGTGAAVYTLNGAPASCTGAAVGGIYATGTPLNIANVVTISVMVTTIGTYNLTTTFQGMTFTAAGAFTTTGANTISLAGTGTPTTGGANTVPLTVGATTCSFVVNVGSAAVGTLGGGPGGCTPSTVAGVYTVGTALVAASNTVQVQLNITTPGAYTVSTNTVGGFSFAASGNATSTGTQLVTIPATGTPTTAGVQTFTVTFGTSTCTFTVTVLPAAGGAVGTLGGGPGACTPSTVNGTYTVGTALAAGNTVQVQINATTAGTYTVSTNTVTGFSFSGTGTATLGTQLITLTGTGNPTTAGAQTFTVTFGTSTCTFTVNVVALSNDYFPRTTNSNWSYEDNDIANDSLYKKVIANTLTVGANVYNIFMSNDGTVPLPALDSGGYYRKAGGSYYERFDYGDFIGYDNPGWDEYIMLKDDVAANTNWKTPVTGLPGTASGTAYNLRFSMTILQKDVSITIVSSLGSVTYQNVIVVQEKLEIEAAPGIWQDATTALDFYGKSYYARGIGLIQYEQLNAANAVTGKRELRRYQVF